MIGLLRTKPLDIDSEFLGEGAIIRGLFTGLLPGLKDRVTTLDSDGDVRAFDYLIYTGGPGWADAHRLPMYDAAIQHRRPVVLFSVGTGWWPWERPAGLDVVAEHMKRLIRSGLLRLVTFRDTSTLYWFRRWGLSIDDAHVLPCQGFYSMPVPPGPTTGKMRVALDVVDTRVCSCATKSTFDRYYDQLHSLRAGLVKRGCTVTVQTHEDEDPSSIEFIRSIGFPDVVRFANKEQYDAYYGSIDVYIGAKVHGALPCAGIGKPCFGLGVDGRQVAWEQIPQIKMRGIHESRWCHTEILRWWDALDPESVSRSLLAWRKKSWQMWQDTIRAKAPFLMKEAM